MTTNAQLDQVMALLGTGQLAMELYRADQDAKLARDAYHAKVKEFEKIYLGGLRVRINPENEMHARIVEFTKEEFALSEAAKKKAYRAKRKLMQACEKIAGKLAIGGAK